MDIITTALAKKLGGISISKQDVTEAVEGYLTKHPEAMATTDDTLSVEGIAADAKAVGDAIEAIEPGLSGEAKTALLNCFAHVAWVDEHGQDYYDALEDALEDAVHPVYKEWDYEWSASSNTPPQDLTYAHYDFTTEQDAMFVRGGNLDFNYIGDCEIEFLMKGPNSSAGNNNPRIAIIGSNSSWCDILFDRTANQYDVAEGASGSVVIINDIHYNVYHTYNIVFENGTYVLRVDGNIVATGNGRTGSVPEWVHTGLISYQGDQSYNCLIKNIKFKRLWDHIVEYKASNGVALHSFDSMEAPNGEYASGFDDVISNNLLNIQLSGSNRYQMSRLKTSYYTPANVSVARARARVKINTLNSVNVAETGFVMTIKAGDKCAGIYASHLDSSSYGWAIRDSSNNFTNKVSMLLNNWYTVECVIANNQQIIKVNDITIYSGEGNNAFGSSGIVILRNEGSQYNINVDIDWMTFEWNDAS